MENAPIKKRYYIVSGIVLLLGLILLFLPFKKNRSKVSPENLLLAISNEDRFYSPDKVAKLIISEDPSIQLIDVRTPEEFAAFSLPGAINIPLSALLDKDEKGYYLWEGYLNQKIKTIVLYSNGSVYANQAWMLTKRLNFKNNYVLKGGLNSFFKTIIKAEKPLNSAPESEQELYQFRKAAAMFFGGGGSVDVSPSPESQPIQNLPPKKKKEKAQSGGC
ncbi:MAG: rhodanese-like domain-containing protein [Bacteroidales bacterium]|nr:rhodanese-like domain-containing protein [Bacteroidales bacterium]